MLFKYYKNKKLVRSCEYTLDLEGECISEKKWGKKLVCENDDIEIGQPEDGYDDFYYPLKIMKYLGITFEDINKSFELNCLIYKLNDNSIENIKKSYV
jgi:hypothetical protein